MPDTTNVEPANRNKRNLDQEIEVLKCIQCTDKSYIPEELKYHDRGYMYFPSKELLSLLRGLDGCVMENANESTLILRSMAPK